MATARTGYTRVQVWIHWVIVALVVFQFSASGGMEVAFEAEQKGEPVGSGDLLFAYTHVTVGLALFILAVVRIVLRVRLGAPPPPENEPVWAVRLAWVTHRLLYLMILVIPVGGAVAWFGGVEQAAEGHEIAGKVLLALAGLHILGALYNHFILKNDVLGRMLRSGES